MSPDADWQSEASYGKGKWTQPWLLARAEGAQLPAKAREGQSRDRAQQFA